MTKAQRLVEKLGLHYQTTMLAAKDASASMAMTYDVEVWLPSMNAYKEVSSVSWARDYQARRAKTRFRREGEKRTEFVHTLNGSGLATSRLCLLSWSKISCPMGRSASLSLCKHGLALTDWQQTRPTRSSVVVEPLHQRLMNSSPHRAVFIA